MIANDMVTVFLYFTIPVLVMNLLFLGIGLSMEPIRYKRKNQTNDEKVDVKNDEGLSEEDLEQREENVKNLFSQLRDEVDEHLVDVQKQRQEFDEWKNQLREREELLSAEEVAVNKEKKIAKKKDIEKDKEEDK